MTISTALTVTDYILSPIGDAIDSGRIARRWWDAEGAPMARYGWALARPYVAAAGIALLVVTEFVLGLAEMAWANRGRVLPAVDAALEWAFQCEGEVTAEDSSVVEVMPVVEAVAPSPKDARDQVFANIDRMMAEPATEQLTALTAQQLRGRCVEAGVQWRHAHGKNRHMTKAEMIQVLS